MAFAEPDTLTRLWQADTYCEAVGLIFLLKLLAPGETLVSSLQRGTELCSCQFMCLNLGAHVKKEVDF